MHKESAKVIVNTTIAWLLVVLPVAAILECSRATRFQWPGQLPADWSVDLCLCLTTFVVNVFAPKRVRLHYILSMLSLLLAFGVVFSLAAIWERYQLKCDGWGDMTGWVPMSANCMK